MTDQLGHYTIIDELGRGAMAVVWRAHDTRLGRDVALKEPSFQGDVDPSMFDELAQRFVREGEAVARLNHPGIVTVYDAGVFDGRAAIVMELVRGETLADIVSRGSLTLEQALSVADQLLDVVGYAHSQGVIHRDIKPDNIFVLPDNHIKLTDFGIARLGESTGLTQAGQVLGTPGYMAPEQITGSPVDGRADIFATGAVLYEMITGENPFGASQNIAPTAVMYKVVQEPAPAQPLEITGISPAVSSSILQALTKDPAQRFQDADQFRAALRGEIAATVPMQHVPAATAAPAYVPSPATVQTVSGRPSWFPYAAIGALGVIAIVVLLIVATSGSPGSSGVAVSETPMPAESAPAADPEPVAEPEPEPEPDVTESQVRSAIDDWLYDWESLNIGSYMSHYSDSFYSGYKGYDISAWRSWKSDSFRQHAYENITIYSLEITANGPTARAVFNQEFACDAKDGGIYTDYGRKTMEFAMEDGKLKIMGEEWREY